jgi:hypothetical protein
MAIFSCGRDIGKGFGVAVELSLGSSITITGVVVVKG